MNSKLELHIKEHFDGDFREKYRYVQDLDVEVEKETEMLPQETLPFETESLI